MKIREFTKLLCKAHLSLINESTRQFAFDDVDLVEESLFSVIDFHIIAIHFYSKLIQILYLRYPLVQAHLIFILKIIKMNSQDLFRP